MEDRIIEAFRRFRSNLAFSPPELIEMRIDALESEILSIVGDSPQQRYDKAWLEYIENHDVIRADGGTICPQCHRPYHRHLQPLKNINPTIRILCHGQAVKL